MAMTIAGMKAAIITQLGAVADSAVQDAFATAIATAVVNYIKSNGAVSVATGITVATTGTAAAQSGTTTSLGSGTIS